MMTNKQRGQIILILILVMTVALAIGLSVIQRSLSDISTASKVEQSARAFSAAEAGIENALLDSGGESLPGIPETQTLISVTGNNWLPEESRGGNRQDPIQYPRAFWREEVANFWLQDPDTDFTSASYYKQPDLDIYWGSVGAAEKPAVELTAVYYGTDSTYKSMKWFLDPDATRANRHGFTPADNFCPDSGYSLSGALTDGRPIKYFCKYTITNLPTPSTTGVSILLRARLLYNDNQHPIAVQAVGICGKDCSLPPQARLLKSTGTAGTTARTVEVFQAKNVVPFYFDYAIFSQGPINK